MGKFFCYCLDRSAIETTLFPSDFKNTLAIFADKECKVQIGKRYVQVIALDKDGPDHYVKIYITINNENAVSAEYFRYGTQNVIAKVIESTGNFKNILAIKRTFINDFLIEYEMDF